EVRPVADLLPGFEVAIWHGIVGPAGMERSLVDRIDEVFRAIITSPEVRSFVETRQAADVVAAGPDAFAAFIARQIALWEPVIREGGIRAE
ncbi:MAG: tripartite tricarboxylate transporter substrate-binding protein, partial [Elioraea sp.]|nr:tripartite tricarboxylate transporter substrate-binding protein [Elioraea sp.]